MEYVDGTGLREYLNRARAFDLAQIIAIMTQLLHALDFAHGRGVVHRDIKPANLILTEAGALKVADFGIARIDTSNLTMTGLVMGTPSYMSPEQCHGRPSDHRSDLFSAGVVFYELLTGRSRSRARRDDRLPDLPRGAAAAVAAVELKLPPAMDELVATALGKDPTQRFQNARAFGTCAAARRRGPAAAGTGDATVVNLAEVPLQPAGPATWDDTVLTTVERQLAQHRRADGEDHGAPGRTAGARRPPALRAARRGHRRPGRRRALRDRAAGSAKPRPARRARDAPRRLRA
jgi:serine/threonine-protein kinase